jgi:hypothetical protein
MFTWLQYSTRRELRESIKEEIRTKLDQELHKQAEEIRTKINEELRKQAKEIRDSTMASFRQLLDQDRADATVALLRQSQIHDVIAEGLPWLARIRQPEPLTEPNRRTIGRIIVKIKRNLEQSPGDRSLVIHYGRFLRWYSKDLGSAVNALEAAIEYRRRRRRSAGTLIVESVEVKEDDAAILYNIACYKNQLVKAIPSDCGDDEQLRRRAKLLDEARSALQESIGLDNLNSSETQTDEDLEGLRLS